MHAFGIDGFLLVEVPGPFPGHVFRRRLADRPKPNDATSASDDTVNVSTHKYPPDDSILPGAD
jgi:hypothetical protein